MTLKVYKQNKGKITQVISRVAAYKYEKELPAILNALECQHDGKRLVMEVAQHLGDSSVRAIAMDSTDGLTRGTEVVDTGKTITVPVGPETLGRIINVIGEPVDERGDIKAKNFASIHQPAPEFTDQ